MANRKGDRIEPTFDFTADDNQEQMDGDTNLSSFELPPESIEPAQPKSSLKNLAPSEDAKDEIPTSDLASTPKESVSEDILAPSSKKVAPSDEHSNAVSTSAVADASQERVSQEQSTSPTSTSPVSTTPTEQTAASKGKNKKGLSPIRAVIHFFVCYCFSFVVVLIIKQGFEAWCFSIHCVRDALSTVALVSIPVGFLLFKVLR